MCSCLNCKQTIGWARPEPCRGATNGEHHDTQARYEDAPEGTRCLIVECEWSTDEKLKRGGIKEGFAQDAALMDMAEVVFLLNGPALHQKKRLREFFGENVPM